ncbi:MAG: glycosyltransferase family 4 protein [Burkholderiaceae bacterium]
MKVLLISREYPFGVKPSFGGGGSHVLYLAYALAKQGHEIVIVAHPTARKNISPLAAFENVHVKATDWKMGIDVIPERALQDVLKVCHEFQPSVIHGHHIQGAFVGLAAAIAYNKPLVITIHKPPVLADEAIGLSRPSYKRRASAATWRVLCTDNRICAHVAYSKIHERDNKFFGVETPIQIIHGVPQDLLRMKAGKLSVERFGINANDNIVLCPMRPEKHGVFTLLGAMRILCESGVWKRSLKLVITSPADGPHARTYRELMRNFGLPRSCVLFKAFTLRQMWDMYHRAQVCVLPSLREGMPISVLEAMAIGTPIIATEAHGINEAIEDETTGLLFSPGNEQELADKIRMLLEDKALCKAISTRAQDRVHSTFSAERMANQYVELYNKVQLRNQHWA